MAATTTNAFNIRLQKTAWHSTRKRCRRTAIQFENKTQKPVFLRFWCLSCLSHFIYLIGSLCLLLTSVTICSFAHKKHEKEKEEKNKKYQHYSIHISFGWFSSFQAGFLFFFVPDYIYSPNIIIRITRFILCVRCSVSCAVCLCWAIYFKILLSNSVGVCIHHLMCALVCVFVAWAFSMGISRPFYIKHM